MSDILPHLERNLAQAVALGEEERAKKLKARIGKELKAREPKPEPKPKAKKAKAASEEE